MTDVSDIPTRADLLLKMRALLAAIEREAANRGAMEVVDLAKKADEAAPEMLRRGLS